ncbi:helix-turn-helix domain-containing protein [Streptomyces sp. NBC_01497]|uniref:helix-turn-helix domain-containing protein n=1 Tax=Streptomyces sp. NBC_01497 TaxID=2903885 RepID=UPI002E368C1A|nr:helix-turn-helix transcriptional regulator [Streptomyces sp. NBC_01497]
MPQRTTPTQRQRRLGSELRRIRTAAGMSAEIAAGLLGVDRGKISNMESGIRGISADRLRTLACNCDVTDTQYVDALVELAQSATGWWESYRGILSGGLLDIAELEWHARRIFTVQTVHVPGLLQTEDYARSVFDSVLPPLSRQEVELRVRNRLERQRVLDAEIARPYDGYVHEAALLMQFGGRRVAHEQLDHLCAATERDHVSLRVIPFAAGAFPGAGHALLYAEGAVSELDTAQVDTAHGAEFVHAEAQLAKYRAHLAWMDQHCLSVSKSLDLVHRIAKQL